MMIDLQDLEEREVIELLLKKLQNEEKKPRPKPKGKATRPLELNEYQQVIELLLNGFVTATGAVVRPNPQVALALQLQACLGLRIGDTLALKVNNFRNGKLEVIEEKTGKLQYRDINRDVYYCVKDYALVNKLSISDKLFVVKVRAVQKQLKLVTEYLELTNIGTHSFRKMFAQTIYEQNGHNLELVKRLLNHTSIETTQKYIKVSQQEVDTASSSVNFMI